MYIEAPFWISIMSQTRQNMSCTKYGQRLTLKIEELASFIAKISEKFIRFFTVLTRTSTWCLNIRIFIALSRSDLNDDSNSLICEAYYSM